MNKIKNIVLILLFISLTSRCSKNKFTGFIIDNDYIEIHSNPQVDEVLSSDWQVNYLKKHLPNANKMFQEKLEKGYTSIEFLHFIKSTEFNNLIRKDLELLKPKEKKICLLIIDFLNNNMREEGKFFSRLKAEGLIKIIPFD